VATIHKPEGAAEGKQAGGYRGPYVRAASTDLNFLSPGVDRSDHGQVVGMRALGASYHKVFQPPDDIHQAGVRRD
jgi:hypothetical protein